MVYISSVPFNAIPGISNPLLLLFICSMALRSGSEPSVLMPTFCALINVFKRKKLITSRRNFFIMKNFHQATTAFLSGKPTLSNWLGSLSKWIKNCFLYCVPVTFL